MGGGRHLATGYAVTTNQLASMEYRFWVVDGEISEAATDALSLLSQEGISANEVTRLVHPYTALGPF